eukprot:TRINITY_DN8046_c0_g1_i1.p1 TRINITY_DN8046_c0_g1~~TRINITY_DN8046_c0_g1_i1.p1  ORF type:complete len:165 (+),score=31.07 TRINITY_DN8046_c0_g1_i1:61-555(+)
MIFSYLKTKTTSLSKLLVTPQETLNFKKLSTMSNCIFCKIVNGSIPSSKLIETNHSLAFLDIAPLSPGHVLVIPKVHSEFLHEISDEALADILPVVKKIAIAIGSPNYNILQNNGRLAHQEVPHAHFHIIPKPDQKQGLGVKWPVIHPTKEEIEETFQKIRTKL